MFQVNMYAIHKEKGCYPIQGPDIQKENDAGADIYWTINNFSAFGARKKEDLREITGFFVDMDEGRKPEMWQRLMSCVSPSCVIETKRGYQAHWYLKEPISTEEDPIKWADWFREFQLKRIVPPLNADIRAADASHLVRAAFCRYWKDGKGTFVTDIVWDCDAFYTLEEIENAFPEPKPQRPFFLTENSKSTPRIFNPQEGTTFWQKANQIPCMSALQRLSGTQHVASETYAFKKKSDGTTRVQINGKSANVWLDKDEMIGSTDHGGPSIPQWLFWYHKDWKRVAKILEEVWPELKK